VSYVLDKLHLGRLAPFNSVQLFSNLKWYVATVPRPKQTIRAVQKLDTMHCELGEKNKDEA